MAAMVSALGTKGANGNCFSIAMRVNSKRTASDTVNPIAAKTCAASFFYGKVDSGLYKGVGRHDDIQFVVRFDWIVIHMNDVRVGCRSWRVSEVVDGF